MSKVKDSPDPGEKFYEPATHQTLCMYCCVVFPSPAALATHTGRKHPHTFAASYLIMRTPSEILEQYDETVRNLLDMVGLDGLVSKYKSPAARRREASEKGQGSEIPTQRSDRERGAVDGG